MENQKRKTLFNDNKELAESLASRFTNNSVELDDLKQESLLALWVATDKFDETRSTNFSMYAYYVILSAIKDYMYQNKSIVSTPQWIGRIQHYLKQIKTLVESAGILEDQDCCIEEFLATPSHPLEELLSFEDRDKLHELKSYIRTYAASDEAYTAAVEKAKEVPYVRSLKEEDITYKIELPLSVDIHEALNSLGITSSAIYRLKLAGYTYKEISEKTGISKTKVYDLLKEAKQTLISKYGEE